MDDDEGRKKALDCTRPEMPWEREGTAASSHVGWMTAGFEFAGAVVLCGGIGYWLDDRFGWKPWGMVVGAMVGVAAGMYRLISRALYPGGRKAGAKGKDTPR